MRIVAWFAGAVLMLVTGCSVGSGPITRDTGYHHEGGYPDAGSLLPDAALTAECDAVNGCTTGRVCVAVMGVPRCVIDPNPAPPGDGTHCEPCPAPGQCRMNVCVQPSATGGLCEFDSGCTTSQFCISGSCTRDPRIPVPCTDVSVCSPGFTCTMGTCHCVHTTDCPSGFMCSMGSCVAGPGCISDSMCPYSGTLETP